MYWGHVSGAMGVMIIGQHPDSNKQTNKNLRCGNRKGLLSRNDQTHHRMGPKTMESIPPSSSDGLEGRRLLMQCAWTVMAVLLGGLVFIAGFLLHS